MRRAALLLASVSVIALPASGAGAASIPPPHCDPAACPDPVKGLQGCADGAVTAVRYILQGTPQPQECRPLGR